MKYSKIIFIGLLIQLTTLFSQHYYETAIDINCDGLSYTKPAFADLDNDGKLDLIVGNSDGKLYHYEQSTINATAFDLVSANFNGIDVGNLSAPTFIDLDKDGLLDLIIGNSAGKIFHYEQNSVGSVQFNLMTANFNNIDISGSSTPAFCDLNNDGLLELFVGTGNFYFTQSSEDPYNFQNLQNLNGLIIEDGYPIFTDLDNDGLCDLLVGKNTIIDSYLVHYEQTSINELKFNQITNRFIGRLDYYGPNTDGIKTTGMSSPTFADINNDGFQDLIIGSDYSGFKYYQRHAGIFIKKLVPNENNIQITESYPKNFKAIAFDSNSGSDLLYSWKLDEVEISTEPEFIYTPDYNSAGLHILTLNIHEANGDYVFNHTYNINVLEFDQEIIITNLSPANQSGSNWNPINQTINETDSINFSIEAHDPDNNSLEYQWLLNNNEVSTDQSYTYKTNYNSAGTKFLTLKINDNFGSLKNTRTFQWVIEIKNVNRAPVISAALPTDSNIVINETSSLNFEVTANDPDGNELSYTWKVNNVCISGNLSTFNYEFNTGVDYEVVVVVEDENLYGANSSITKKWYVKSVVDIDDKDLIPNFTGLNQNYPNPFNNSTVLSYRLNNPAEVSLSVYNSRGELVKTLVKGQKSAGSHTVSFDASGLSSGIYHYTLKTKDKNITNRMLLIK